MVYSSPPSRNEALVMIDTTVDVINKLGLHARASGKLIEVTTKFRSSIRIGKADKLVDAKNIMSLLMLGAGKGTTLRLVIEGAEIIGNVRNTDIGQTRFFTIHLLNRRRKNDVTTDLCQKLLVLLKRARIAIKIFIGSKLDRIDKDTDHHYITQLTRFTHQV